MSDAEDSEGLSVAQMSAATGMSGYTLRYYERAGLIQPIPRTSGNQRRYRQRDVEWVQFLLRLKETGMPIATMREYAALRAQGETSLRLRLDMLTSHDEYLQRQVAMLQTHQQALRTKIEIYRQMIADTQGDPDD